MVISTCRLQVDDQNFFYCFIHFVVGSLLLIFFVPNVFYYSNFIHSIIRLLYAFAYKVQSVVIPSETSLTLFLGLPSVYNGVV